MCSIMGLSTRAVGRQELEGYFERSVSRGPDSSRLMETGRGWLGFHRLSIMGLDERGMQPFCLRGKAAVCNGEIYGFRAMREDLKRAGYDFAGESDCELILPLYERYGLDMFAILDAEFALILFDAKTPRGALPGGMGLVFDWSLLAGYRGATDWALAGGLSADNVGEALRITGAPLVDTSSGVESAPGVKDPARIAAFCAAAASAYGISVLESAL